MKGDRAARARSRGPIKERVSQAVSSKETWCPCGSKMDITTKIQMHGQPAKLACASCGDKAPLHAHVSRLDKQDLKNHNDKYMSFFLWNPKRA